MNRRKFLSVCAAAGAARIAGAFDIAPSSGASRKFHLCTSPDPLDAEPDRLNIYANAGLAQVWIAGYFYGYWPASPDRIQAWRKRFEQIGIQTGIVNIPLGHPGDSLGAASDEFPLTPPKGWKMAVRPDGSQYSGTSLHPPATEGNCEALRELNKLGVRQVFLDDDFRLATGPGTIGGCFCDEHRDAFLKQGGYNETDWKSLLDDVATRSLSPLLRSWVDYTCDQLTACYRAQQAAVPDIQLGNMVMYFGAEKAGIRLPDYTGSLFRVGELMFDDKSFASVKSKTAELFSCLFHRRFTPPELAYSETTAFPADKLSAKNMAAKLAVSTIADVRNTMFMSGITPFPRAHWDTLIPAMKRHTTIHEKLAGHALRGPFKHYWGEHSRYVGNDNPNSLFLAAGIPFEVTDRPAADGWTFLSDADAAALDNRAFAESGTMFATRTAVPHASNRSRQIGESLEELFALKREIMANETTFPYVEDEKPAVCAWYPTARAVLLWNLGEERETLALRLGRSRREVVIDGLDVALVEDVG